VLVGQEIELASDLKPSRSCKQQLHSTEKKTISDQRERERERETERERESSNGGAI